MFRAAPPARLSPPVETILIYAAYGWADLNGFKSASGRPRLPERAIWLPLFHRLAAAKNGLSALKRYAKRGCAAWRVPVSIAACLDDAFADRQFPALLQIEFEHLAATASPPMRLAQWSTHAASAATPPAPPTLPRPPAAASGPASKRKPGGPSHG
ncbi:hypothetical protein [Nitrospirillum bahiense]|uniref:Uncharacterized protein n=1 Tax=Nitrospirillum amazonense TaxID=28077 RepID=A0A560FHM5_9PROT|nr:hypothetical protein [Nitrospirillum amazonense]TWB21107.1 hypothetical protein FBZ88_11981 [Nitrospirillum amazonense]